MAEAEVEVDGQRLRVTNLDKVLWPARGFTKGEMIDYYARIAPVMLPHLADRPVTRKRYPNGVDGQSFYEKNCPDHRPEWVDTVDVASERHRFVTYCMVDDLPTLIWLAQLAAIELHVPMACASDLDTPRAVVFDLDPGPPAGLVECGRVAIRIREMLDHLGLRCIPKTSGSKGMQLYVPINTPVGYDRTTPFAQAVAQVLEKAHPDDIVSVMRRDVRPGKIFVDWSQNSWHKTTVCAYSLRARTHPTVSAPLTWDEVDDMVAGADPDSVVFEAPDVLDRVERLGDLFAPVIEVCQELPVLG